MMFFDVDAYTVYVKTCFYMYTVYQSTMIRMFPVLASHIDGLPRCPMTCPPGFSLSGRRMLSPHQRVVREWPRAWCGTHLAQTELLLMPFVLLWSSLSSLTIPQKPGGKWPNWEAGLGWKPLCQICLSSFADWFWFEMLFDALWAKVLFIESWQSTQRAGPSPASHQTWLHHPQFWKETIKPL